MTKNEYSTAMFESVKKNVFSIHKLWLNVQKVTYLRQAFS